MSEKQPIGEERKVQFLSGETIDGAPVSYIVVLAAVVVALSFIPISVIIALGGSFPMSQGVLGLVGWVLGPVAGAVASGIGALIGIFLAPHTAGPIPLLRIWGSLIASFAAGTMVIGAKRKGWWFCPCLYALLSLLYFIGRAVFINGVGLWVAIAAAFIDWSAIILLALPTRTLFAKWINSKNWGLVLAGLGLGTWTVYGISHICLTAIYYHVFNYPEVVFYEVMTVAPFENLLRAIVGMVIGGGVIAGLRAIGLVKPEHAIY